MSTFRCVAADRPAPCGRPVPVALDSAGPTRPHRPPPRTRRAPRTLRPASRRTQCETEERRGAAAGEHGWNSNVRRARAAAVVIESAAGLAAPNRARRWGGSAGDRSRPAARARVRWETSPVRTLGIVETRFGSRAFGGSLRLAVEVRRALTSSPRSARAPASPRVPPAGRGGRAAC